MNNNLQYTSNTPKYTTSNPYWMQNNLLLDIPFCMHNDLKIIIKIFSTIYLSLVVIFTFVSLYWHHESWAHKTWTIVNDTAKKGSTTNHSFSTTIRPLIFLNLIDFYSSVWKVLHQMIGTGNRNLTHGDIIFAAPNFGIWKHDVSSNNTFY